MKYLKTFNESHGPEFYKVPPEEKTMFGPSFGAKVGQTDFYQLRIEGRPVAEIEVHPNSKLGKPEIMSLYSDIKGRGFGQLLANKILDIYLEDEVFVLSTKGSRKFWLKCGATPVEGEDPYLLHFVNYKK